MQYFVPGSERSRTMKRMASFLASHTCTGGILWSTKNISQQSISILISIISSTFIFFVTLAQITNCPN